MSNEVVLSVFFFFFLLLVDSYRVLMLVTYIYVVMINWLEAPEIVELEAKRMSFGR